MKRFMTFLHSFSLACLLTLPMQSQALDIWLPNPVVIGTSVSYQYFQAGNQYCTLVIVQENMSWGPPRIRTGVICLG